MVHQLLLLARDKKNVARHQSAVSLHSHTRHSRENLGFLGRFLESRRYLYSWVQRQAARCHRTTGIALDFDRAYWTPPLCEQLAWQLEAGQIQSLGLRPLVSLSDHDSIQAASLLRPSLDVPISTEWSLPFGSALFHLGIHNLPAAGSTALFGAMQAATAAATESRSIALLAELAATPGVLVVFNHPLWNFNRTDPGLFRAELRRFLSVANPSLHAFECNGMRSHQENSAVFSLAAAWNQVVVSGGDRHGCEPNALLNLTDAADFPEFVDEVRTGRHSRILVMPQYQLPLRWRFYRNFTEVIAHYPAHPLGRRDWDQRTFHPNAAGQMLPVAQLWQVGPPCFLKRMFASALFAAGLPFQDLLCPLTRKKTRALVAQAAAPSPDAASVGGLLLPVEPAAGPTLSQAV